MFVVIYIWLTALLTVQPCTWQRMYPEKNVLSSLSMCFAEIYAISLEIFRGKQAWPKEPKGAHSDCAGKYVYIPYLRKWFCTKHKC